MFVWMVKSDGYWIPTVFGWLPDKSEEIYKVFFLVVKEKMKEFGLRGAFIIKLVKSMKLKTLSFNS